MNRYEWEREMLADGGTLSGPGFLWGLPVFGAVFVLLAVVVLAKVSGRLLGVRFGWRRAITAGFTGFVLGWASTWLLGGAKRVPQSLSWQGVFFAGLIATMLIAAAQELLARPGRFAEVEGRLRGIPHPFRSLRQRARRSRRYLQVTRIAARHGLSSYLGGRRAGVRPAPLARNVTAALEEAGGMFIKLGQVLSTRSDLLPPEFIAELSRLQDRVPPADPARVAALLTAELGAPPQTVFTAFEAAPLAAASIAQAHRAQLSTGEQVIVKVQRPDVRAMVERDLDILLRMARTLEARAAWAREYAVLGMTQGFADALREELDFGIEARNIAAVAGAGNVRVPAVYDKLSTSRVLVLEYLDGVSVRDASVVLDSMDGPADRHRLARELLSAMLRQIMLEGTFHADPHPGNVLVLRDGQLALIDFGSVGRLDPLQQAALRRLLLAIARRNPAELHDALLDLAQVRRLTADDLLERTLAQFIAQHLGPGMVPGAVMFNALFQLLLDFGVVFPPVIGGVFRAMVTLEGTLARLCPGFQIVEESRQMAVSWLGEMFGPASLKDAATDEVLGMLPVLRRLPRRFDRITMALERGTLSASVRMLADERDRQFIRSQVGRAVLAFLGAALGVMSVMLLAVHGGPVYLPASGHSGGTSLFHVFGYIGLFFSLVLILRVVITIIREGI